MTENNQITKQPYLLENKIQNYEWGTRGEKAFIPNFIGAEIKNDTPYAELWIGTNPKACSDVTVDKVNISLADFIDKFPAEILGKETAVNCKNRFPYLLKVLSAAEALSIQAHPNKEFAKILHAKDPVNYPDDNHKPEIAIALDSLTALAGFKSVSDLLTIFQNNPEITNFIELGNLDSYEGIGASSSTEKTLFLKMVFENLLTNAKASPDKVKETVNGLIKRISAKEAKLTETEKLFLELSAKNSNDDIGLLVVFFLQMVHLKKGEAIFTGAGIPHAYIKGDIVECMANSDNVVRAGLTSKFKDIDALKKIAYYNVEPLPIIKNSNELIIFPYPAPVEEFNISKIELGKYSFCSFNTNDSFETLLIAEGEIVISDPLYGTNKYEYSKGAIILIPAFLEKYQIYAKSKSIIFRVTVNL
jgi:mannose-6-phosphate isomerase